MPTESEEKRKITQALKAEGGYARRIEDQYAVGFPDMVLIPVGMRPFFVEAKIVRGPTFKPRPRQFAELQRIAATGDGAAAVIMGIEIIRVGCRNYYMHPNRESIHIDQCFTFGVDRENPLNVTQMLKEYEQWLTRT